MKNLSVVIITKNEERNIKRCLESVLSVADEIVIVDSFSNDRTVEIATQFKAKIVQQEFLGYIEQKNFAIQQATHDFILSLDADEALSTELKNSIAKAKSESNGDAYTMSRMTSYCGQWIKHGGWYPDRKVRFFNRKVARWGGINPHDKIEVDNNVEVKLIEGDILHYTYYNLSEHIQQADRFTKIMAKDLFENGKRTNLLRILFKPKARFFRDYIFKRGFLDGYNGLLIAIISSYAVFLREIRLKEHWDNNG
jgi:glycosyltransferase involved in cell wall biosynthesis